MTRFRMIQADGEQFVHAEHDGCRESSCVPVAVLDPEDYPTLRELFQRSNAYQPGELLTPYIEGFQYALRRQVASPEPSKPDQPEGLGAVVQDRHGFWVRSKSMTTLRHWFHSEGAYNGRTWEEFGDDVRVLSEGVQS